MERAGIPVGATILDPFMGSGSTGVACVESGRNFIGTEIHRGYYELACRRLARARERIPLFASDQAGPEQLSIFDLTE